MRTSPRSGDWLTLPGAVAGGTSSTGWSSGGGAAGSLAIALALSAGAAASGVRSAVQAASASASSAIADVIGFMHSAPCKKQRTALGTRRSRIANIEAGDKRVGAARAPIGLVSRNVEWGKGGSVVVVRGGRCILYKKKQQK